MYAVITDRMGVRRVKKNVMMNRMTSKIATNYDWLRRQDVTSRPMPNQAMSQLNDKIVDACGREKAMSQLPGTSGQAGRVWNHNHR